jgi:hypothetical protein
MRYFVRVDLTVMRFRLEFAISYEIHSLHLEKYFLFVAIGLMYPLFSSGSIAKTRPDTTLGMGSASVNFKGSNDLLEKVQAQSSRCRIVGNRVICS